VVDLVIQRLQGLDSWAADLYGTLRGVAVYLELTENGSAAGAAADETAGPPSEVEGILLEVARQLGDDPIYSWNPETSFDLTEWSSQLLAELTMAEGQATAKESLRRENDVKDDARGGGSKRPGGEASKREMLLSLSEKAIQMKIALTTLIPWAQDCRSEALTCRKERDAANLQRDGALLQLEAQIEVMEAMEKENDTAARYRHTAKRGLASNSEVVAAALAREATVRRVDAKGASGEEWLRSGGNVEELKRLHREFEKQLHEARKM
jgi:hypothetical protein